MGASRTRKAPPETPPSRVWRWLALASGAAFLILASHAAWVETPTIDEFAHVPAGCAYWVDGRFDLYSKNPPLWKMVMAAPVLLSGANTPVPRADADAWTPWLYGYGFLSANQAQYFQLFWLARMTTVLATLAGGAMLFFWTRQLFDERAAAITALLFYLNPNILAHGHLATIDAACAVTVLATLFAVHWAYRQASWQRLVVVGIIWGIALATKFTAVLLLPVLLGLILIERWWQWRVVAVESAALLASAWLVVNLSMAFQGSMARLDSYQLVSDSGITLQQTLPGWLPVPLPRSYVVGFDLQKRDTERGEFGNYLFGTWSDKAWWHYNLVALVVKNPLPTIALVLIAPWFWRRWKLPRAALMQIALPLAVLLIGMMFFNRLNIGVRYLLPIFPLALLLAGAVWQGRQKWQPWLAGLLVLMHAGTALFIHPSYLSYFNLAVGGPGTGHLVLLDSNLDWGQDLYRVPQALADIDYRGPVGMLYFGHVPPSMYGIDYHLPPSEPVEGVLAISVQFFMGGSYVVTGPDGMLYQISPQHIAWLRQFTPRVKAGSIWIFDTRSSAASATQ